MLTHGPAVRISIYLTEDDHAGGRSAAQAVLELLRREGAAGASALRGQMGLGAAGRLRTAALVELAAGLPLVVEWIDTPENAARLLPQVQALAPNALIVRQPVEVVQPAVGRAGDPMALPVSALMRGEVETIAAAAPAAEAVARLLRAGERTLLVVDEAGRPEGIVTDGDLLRRLGLSPRLAAHAGRDSVGEPMLRAAVAEFEQSDERVVDVMNDPVVVVEAREPVRKAAALMAERGLKRLPVVDSQRRLVGLIARIDILDAAAGAGGPLAASRAQPATATPRERDSRTGASPAAPPAGQGRYTVADLMWTDVPTVPPEAGLEEIVVALETNRRRRAVVVDAERRPLGVITDGDLLHRSRLGKHPGLLARLAALMVGPALGRGPAAAGEAARAARYAGPLASAGETAAHLMSTPAITVSADTPPAEALRIMAQQDVKRLPVVDADGRLVGLLGRASLLRGLLAG